MHRKIRIQFKAIQLKEIGHKTLGQSFKRSGIYAQNILVGFQLKSCVKSVFNHRNIYKLPYRTDSYRELYIRIENSCYSMPFGSHHHANSTQSIYTSMIQTKRPIDFYQIPGVSCRTTVGTAYKWYVVLPLYLVTLTFNSFGTVF